MVISQHTQGKLCVAEKFVLLSYGAEIGFSITKNRVGSPKRDISTK
jgi:hypothetical protein